ncbi:MULTISPECIES: ABC transporter permease subunit [Haloarcula]|uniref:ABC transporter permease subunit n=1 Tax=Haloarcula TaxID=2237 RepID=UPI0023ECB7E3|nr:ABC transporter permease subunit [Halomicroarcula sp. XH51]
MSGRGDRNMRADMNGVDAALRDQFDWYPVAKKEFKDAIRSRGFLVLSVLFTVFFMLPPASVVFGIFDFGPQGQDVGMQFLISSVYLNMVTLLVPVVALFVGYAAITKERTSGSLKLLLSLPFSRRDVLVGKVIGRCVVAGVTLGFALALTALFFVASELTFKGDLFGLFVLYTMAFTVVFVAIVVSISGAFSTSFRSAIASFFVYFYFTFGWNSLANGIGDLLADYLGVTGSLRWNVVLLVKLVNPNQAYKTLTNSMLAEGSNAMRSSRFGMFSQNTTQMQEICTGVLNGNATLQRGLFGNTTVCGESARSIPFYVSDPAVFVYMVAWIGVAAALAYYTFSVVDL